MVSDTTIYVSSYYYISLLILVHMCLIYVSTTTGVSSSPSPPVPVSSFCYMCSHTTIYVCVYDRKGRDRGGKCITLVLAPPHIHTRIYVYMYTCMWGDNRIVIVYVMESSDTTYAGMKGPVFFGI